MTHLRRDGPSHHRTVLPRTPAAPCANWRIDVALKGVGERKRASLAQRRASTRCSTCSRRTRGAGSTAPTRPVWPTSSRGGGAGAGDGAIRAKRAMRNRRTMVEAVVGDGTGRLHVVFFNQPWRERQLRAGPAGRPVRQGRRVPGRAADDEPGRRPDRRPHRAHRADLSAEREGRSSTTWEIAGWVEDALERCRPRGIADPVPAGGAAAAAACIDRHAGAHGTSTCPSRSADKEQARRRLAFDELLRVQLALVHAQAGAGARGAWASATWSDGALVAALPRRPAVPADRRAAAGDRRDRGRPRRRRIRCTGCCRATSAAGKTVVAVDARCWPPCRAGTRAR